MSFDLIKTVITHPANRSARSGFTFLEIMVALSIIALVLVSVYRLQMQSVSAEYVSRFYITAPLLAQEKLAEVESRSLEDLTNDAGDFGEAYPGYTWQLDVSTVENDTLADLTEQFKKIEVAIFLNQDENTYRVNTYRFYKTD
jgi:general secretion pathway protein I